MIAISKATPRLLALFSAASLYGCSEEQPLFLDWLEGASRTEARVEFHDLDAAAIVADPTSNGFTAYSIATSAQLPIVWMLRRRATLTLETFAPGPRELVLEAGPYGAEIGFEISLDGEVLERFAWTETEIARIEIPAERIPPGRHELEIRLDPSVEPSHDLPGAVGTRAFRFAIRQIALLPAAGPTPRLRERWLPAVTGSILHLEGRAADDGAQLWLLRDGPDGARSVVREAKLDAAESFEWEIALDGEPGALRRYAVVEAGELAWSRLGQTIPAAAVESRCNLLLITLDTTRRDALGVYRELDGSALLGDGLSPSRHLDRLAATSTVFRRAFSPAPVTAPAHASIFLSQLPSEHGLRVNGLSLPPSSERSLVTRLRAWGYSTAGFVSLGVLAEDAGFAQDFGHFDDDFSAGWWRGGTELNAALFRWLEGPGRDATRAPSFLWLHYSDPHKPYAADGEGGYGVQVLWNDRPVGVIASVGDETRIAVELVEGEHWLRLEATPAAHEAMGAARQFYEISDLGFSDGRVVWTPRAGVDADGRMGASATYFVRVPEDVTGNAILTLTVEDLAPAQEIRRRYLAEIEGMDASVGAALERLDAAGWLTDAVVAVVADHGEDLGAEDGRYGHVEHLGPTLSNIGMIIRDPTRPAGVMDMPVGVVDLAPTLLGAVGIGSSVAARGRDLFAPTLEPRPLFLESFPPEAKRHQRALIADGYKLEGVVDSHGTLLGGLRLFDLEADPNCGQDLLAGLVAPQSLDGERWGELLGAWKAWTGGASKIPEIDPSMRERLRARGYVE